MAANLRPTQWLALAHAEQRLGVYEGSGGRGVFAWTDVNDIDSSALAATLWAHAEQHVDQDDDLNAAGIRDETAKRVAAALAILAFGTEFVA